MLDHVSIGVRNVARSKRFYDAVLMPLGYAVTGRGDDWVGYGAEKTAFCVAAAARPVPPEMESGLHFCFDAPTQKSVDAFHAGALAAGGRDNGAPGLRAEYGDAYYAAFVIDPDGYRIEAYCAVKA
jgi:catechol 2,3-dioxygenase-like lactoylglutathione lyase family enzyme